MNSESSDLFKVARQFLLKSVDEKYSYNFSWLSRPIIQYPQDIVCLQEVIWKVRPDCIIETGIAHGGSVIFNASMLALLEYCDAEKNNSLINPKKPKNKVIAIDIDIRKHNKEALENHPLKNRFHLLQGSSIDSKIFNKVKILSQNAKNILVILDSNHEHNHVLKELELYSNLVTKSSYCIVLDTIIDELPESMSKDRPWGPGNSPKSAVVEFLNNTNNFEVDNYYENKSLITVAPHGFLKRIK